MTGEALVRLERVSAGDKAGRDLAGLDAHTGVCDAPSALAAAAPRRNNYHPPSYILGD